MKKCLIKEERVTILFDIEKIIPTASKAACFCLFDFDHSEHFRCKTHFEPQGGGSAKETSCNDGLRHSTSIWKVYFYNTQTVQHSAYLFVMK